MSTRGALLSLLILQAITTPLQSASMDMTINKKATHSELGTFDTLKADFDRAMLIEKPKVHVISDMYNKAVKAGEGFELKCEAVGVPPPVVTWTLNGKPFTEHDENINVVEKLRNVELKTIQSGVTVSRIVIPCASKQHEGEFRCIATNGQKRDMASLFVTVAASKGDGCMPQYKVLGPPVITMWSEGRFERMGASVQLYCRASMGMPLDVVWYNEDGIPINDDTDGYEILYNGDLLIHNAQWSHMGVYTCVTSNDFGEDRVPIFFYPTLYEKER